MWLFCMDGVVAVMLELKVWIYCTDKVCQPEVYC